jgi:hypothetical protein
MLKHTSTGISARFEQVRRGSDADSRTSIVLLAGNDE